MNPTTPTALLVERDAHVLKGLQGLLQRELPSWRFRFESDAERAMHTLDRMRPDVVVSELDLPRFEGGAFLREVRRRQPQAVRILLTSYASDDAISDMADVAHQLLTKPLEVPALGAALQHAHQLGAILRDPGLREMVVEDNCLPPAPLSFARLSEVLEGRSPSVEAVAEVLESDPALAARVLQVSQSALFGMSHPPRTVRDAVIRLGLELTRGLTLCEELKRIVRSPPHGFDLEAFAKRGLNTGMVMRRVAPPAERDAAFLTGIVHGVGMLLLVARRPKIFASLCAEAAEREETVSAALYRNFGVTEAELGAYLLGLWRFDCRVVAAVARQHHVEALAQSLPDACDAVYLARRLVLDPDAEVVDAPPVGSDQLDSRFVRAWGGQARLAPWRHTARAVRERD
jgi:HD-like signal output (HDOD) protein/CheY-like chemotaxis protein